MFLKKTLAAFAALALSSSMAVAQPAYPTNNPTYIPSAELAAATFAATGTQTFWVNGIDTVKLGLTGTNTGLVSEVDCSLDQTNWFALKVQPVPGGAFQQQNSITADGNYQVNSSGCREIRYNVTAIGSGSVVSKMIGTPNGSTYIVNPLGYKDRVTFDASVVGAVPAAAATDFITIAGSATKTIHLTRLCVSGRATAAANADVVLVKRSAADTGGTPGTVPTAVPLDSSTAAASATLAYYTANPTLGAAVGNVGVKQLPLGNLTTGAAGTPVCWTWTDHAASEVALRGAAQQLGINLNGGTYSGNLVDVNMEWVED